MAEHFIRIQCKSKSGQIATYLAEGRYQGQEREPESISPLMESLGDLYPWLRANGWTADEYDGDGTFVPWRMKLNEH